jgi:predicted DNA-binding protein (UPF0251 family)
MVRPRRCRWVSGMPDVEYFKPKGARLGKIGQVDLNVEEFEAMKLKDHEKLDQNSAAERMNISQPTFHRLYSEAKEKIAKALVEGLAIKIHGGAYKMPGLDGTGPMGHGKMTGRGRGQCSGAARGGMRRRAGLCRELNKEDEIRLLEAEKKEIERRLSELSK